VGNKKSKNLHYLIILLFVIGAFLRLYNLGTVPLWQDEAETALHSFNVLETGLPVGFYKVPFYENAYLIKSSDEMYAFMPTNYLHTNLVTMKGWLTYYIGAFFMLFGKSNLALRLPFALLGISSLFVVYFFVNKFFNKRTAAIVLFLQAVSPTFLYYERQIRYYSLEILLVFASIYIFIKAFEQRKLWMFIVAEVLLALLFHTHIIACISVIIILFIYAFLFHRGLFSNKSLWTGDLVFLILTVPWLIFAGFSVTSQPHIWHMPGWLSSGLYYPISSATLYTSIYILAELGFLALLVSVFFAKWMKKQKLYFGSQKANLLLLASVIVFLIIPTLLVPYSSFNERLYLPLFVFWLIIIGVFFDKLVSLVKHRIAKLALMLVFLFLTFMHVSSVFGRQGIDFGNQLELITDAGDDWVEQDIEFLRLQGASEDALILTTDEHFTFLWYSDYTVQTIWPVRKLFIDNYDGELWLILRGQPDGVCNHFHMYLQSGDFCEDNKNYLSRIKDCEMFEPGSGSIIYKC